MVATKRWVVATTRCGRWDVATTGRTDAIEEERVLVQEFSK